MLEDKKRDEQELEFEKKEEEGVITEETEETVSEVGENEAEAVYCPELEKQLEQQQQENEELAGRLKRLQADFDNYRRRSRKELEVMARFGSERIILSLLPVIDNFERALAASEGKPELAQFAKGMEMIYRQLKEALEKEGMMEIPAINEPFNPEKHHAVAQVETQDYEDNIIVDELQKGYTLHDKVLRPSAVRVAKNEGNN